MLFCNADKNIEDFADKHKTFDPVVLIMVRSPDKACNAQYTPDYKICIRPESFYAVVYG